MPLSALPRSRDNFGQVVYTRVHCSVTVTSVDGRDETVQSLVWLPRLTQPSLLYRWDSGIFPWIYSPGHFPRTPRHFSHGVGHSPLPVPPSVGLQYKAIYR